MGKFSVLIAAAGRGTRSGLSYPKTLFPINGKPILIRILERFTVYDSCPTVIVSADNQNSIKNALNNAQLNAHLVEQIHPNGMGDAVLKFKASPVYDDSENIILVWGDIPFIQAETLKGVVEAHINHKNDFTFVTRMFHPLIPLLCVINMARYKKLLKPENSG